jgi:GntR family transcriptional regulator
MVDGVNPHLERLGHKPVRASEEVTARTATAEQAVALRLPPGAPILHVIRTTWDEHNTIIEVIFVAAHGRRNTFIYDDLPVY